MSYGASSFGANEFAVQYSPSISFFCVIIGMLIYQRQHYWVVLLTYIFTLIAPLFLPLVDQQSWHQLLRESPQVVYTFFLINIAGAVLNGVFAIRLNRFFRRRLSPYAADLMLAFAVQLGFVVINVVMVGIFIKLMNSYTPHIQQLLGYDENYIHMALKRTFRGMTVILAFILVFYHRPNRRELLYVLPVFLTFTFMGLLHLRGYTVNSEMEAALVSLFIALAVPASVAPLSIALGTSLYSTMTGTFLRDQIPVSPLDNATDYYAILLLAATGFFLSYRGYVTHRERTSETSILRLDAARDFAGVGIFMVNQRTGIIQLDQTARRVLGMTQTFAPIMNVYDRMAPESQKTLIEMGTVSPGETYTYVLRVIRPDQDDCMIRIYIWSQRAESGVEIAYGLVLDISDEHAKETALRHALSDLEARDEKQKRMFSIISHEIRTPASVMAMLIEDLEPENATSAKPKMMEASNQLLNVLTDMRQAVNPEQNLAIIKMPYLPADLAETVRNTYQAQADQHRMRIKIKLGDGAHLKRIGDQIRLKQLIGNLVRNGLLHSHGRNVEISFESQQDDDGQVWSIWTVRDDGIGIQPDQVERLFEPFERGGKDPRIQADGSGLGLYIAKTAVELLGGQIEYVPNTRGASYRIMVPEDIATAEQIGVDPVHKDVDFNHMTVLLAEDNALVAEVTKARLVKMFGEVVVTSNGVAALEVVKADPPDLLITDLFMPHMEGDELIRELKNSGYDFAMVGLTAAAVGNDMDRFKAAGADLLMSKPLDIDKLVDFLSTSTG